MEKAPREWSCQPVIDYLTGKLGEWDVYDNPEGYSDAAVERCSYRLSESGQRLGMAREVWARARREGGLTTTQADRLAIGLGVEPRLLWPDWYDRVMATLTDSDDDWYERWLANEPEDVAWWAA